MLAIEQESSLFGQVDKKADRESFHSHPPAVRRCERLIRKEQACSLLPSESVGHWPENDQLHWFSTERSTLPYSFRI
ncbi:hypothetical protein MDS_3488 [Ectopseudomonas mendocina NK-01]|nr:hypothetical protein MDS_3488 [Pseudomonas mendocina NK-01]